MKGEIFYQSNILPDYREHNSNTGCVVDEMLTSFRRVSNLHVELRENRCELMEWQL